MEFSISNFSGSLPRLADHLIQKGMAKTAIDCKLSTGQLDSFREPLVIDSVPPSSVTMRFFGNCKYDISATCVDWTQAGSRCERYFSTGDTPWPVTGILDADCELQSTRLGIPCPTKAPKVTQQGGEVGEDKDLEGRSYAYQYVNIYGEMGALSPGSKAINTSETQHHLIESWEIPDPEWGITHIRIYRTVNGHETGREEVNVFDTTWMLVDEIEIGSGFYLDKNLNEDLIEAAEVDVAPPPPADLKGITLMESQDTLIGYTGKRVYFSEANSFHSWPHYLELEDTVCGIVESNGLLYAATNGRPYAIVAMANCEGAACREAIRLPGNYPKLGCGNRTMGKIRAGAVYPTHEGLVMLAGKAAPMLLTWNLYTDEQWQQLQPHTAVPVEHGGRLYVFTAGGSFVTKSPESAEQGWNNDFHSQLSDVDVVDAYATTSGELYILRNNGEIAIWDRGEDIRPHEWVSGEFVIPTDRALGAGRMHVDYGVENIKVVVDRRTVLDRAVLSSRVFRLPMYSTGSRWQFTLSGTGRVSLLSLATAMQDLGS